MGNPALISPSDACDEAAINVGADLADCRTGDAHPCRVDPPLIDADELWECADGSAVEFAATLGELWKDKAGYAHRALTQENFFKLLVGVALLSVPLVAFVDWLHGRFTIPIIVMDVDISIGVYPLGAGGFAGGVWKLFEVCGPGERVKRQHSDLSNALQDRMRKETLLTHGRLVATGILRLDIGQEDSGARAEACLEGIFQAWRRIQLIPSVMSREWPFFKNPNVMRRENRIIKPWFRISCGTVAFAYLGLGLSGLGGLHDAVSPEACFSGAGAFIAAAYLLRTFFRDRAFLFVEAIETGLKWHQVGACERELWIREIAKYDPLPQVARKHREALDAFYDLMRRK